MIALLVLILSIRPEATCDRMEVNHVYNDDGRLELKQVIFWNWDHRYGYVSSGWRRWGADDRLRRTPTGWRYESPSLSVNSPSLSVSWTQYDREVAGRVPEMARPLEAPVYIPLP